MEANELMIGDWVQYTDIVDEWGYVPQGKVSKLTHHATFDEQKGSRIQIELPDGFQFYNDIEEHFFPIPLTPDILEKNGFEHYEPYDPEIKIEGYKSKDKRILIRKEKTSESDWFCIIRTKGMMEELMLGISYVHELQHALKLCGIEKEIEL